MYLYIVSVYQYLKRNCGNRTIKEKKFLNRETGY